MQIGAQLNQPGGGGYVRNSRGSKGWVKSWKTHLDEEGKGQREERYSWSRGKYAKLKRCNDVEYLGGFIVHSSVWGLVTKKCSKG